VADAEAKAQKQIDSANAKIKEAKEEAEDAKKESKKLQSL
jgi:hypothetical protein